MNRNVQTGNKVVWLLAALVLVLCSLNVDWGSVMWTEQEAVQMAEHEMDMKGGLFFGGELSKAFAKLGSAVPWPMTAYSPVPLGPLTIPNWTGCVTCGFALLVLILNLVGFSDVPKLVVALLLLPGLLVAVNALVHTASTGITGTGAALLLAASLIGMFQFLAVLKPERREPGELTASSES